VSDPQLLAQRYGRRAGLPRGARVTLVLAGLALLVAGVAVVFSWTQAAQPGVTATVTAYQVVSAERVDVRFTVSKDAAAAAVCRVVAKNRYTDVVGSLDVTIPAGRSQTDTSVSVVTTQRAVVGLVDSCRLTN
jgi:uncharacterized protein (DUF58 family)